MKKDYNMVIKEAKEMVLDINNRGQEALGDDALEFMDSLMSSNEILESDLRVQLIDELVRARNEQVISQKKLEELSGVKQPVIARMETGKTSPQVSTLIKILKPLGKTLAVVPIENN
ncbi:helix-turn-helix transcriptional regulator [Fenollaria massiliensis]